MGKTSGNRISKAGAATKVAFPDASVSTQDIDIAHAIRVAQRIQAGVESDAELQAAVAIYVANKLVDAIEALGPI